MTIAPVTSVNVKQAVPFFGVSNMEASLRIQTRKRPFVGNRLWVVPLIDPDGYRIEFESPSDAPEESELEE